MLPPFTRARRVAPTLLLLLGACSLDVTNPNTQRAVLTPTAVFGTRTYTSVASGFFHSCGLDASGNAWCWGSNQFGQLGTTAVLPGCGAGSCSRIPVSSAEGRSFRQIAPGTTHTCGLLTTGRVLCWGGTTVQGASLLGDVRVTSSSFPVAVVADSLFTQLAVGGTHSCALTASGEAWCWGRNEAGQLGDSSIIARGDPVRVSTSRRFTAIATGADFTCALDTSNAAWCWGANTFGQLGAGDVPFNAIGRNASTPRAVVGGLTWRRLAAGGSHACALTPTGVAHCWGRNNDAHQLGDSTDVTHRGTPAPVAGARSYTELAAGAGTSCARTADGATWCWGGNFFGNAGTGRATPGGERVPTAVVGGPFTSVAPGGSHSCAIDSSGNARCWGDSASGQLGIR